MEKQVAEAIRDRNPVQGVIYHLGLRGDKCHSKDEFPSEDSQTYLKRNMPLSI
jgi:hypothetical protein